MVNEEKKQSNDGQHSILRDVIMLCLGAVLAGAVEVFWVNPAQVAETQEMEQRAIVEVLSKRFDFVELNDEYEDAIEEIYTKYKELKVSVEATTAEQIAKTKTLEDKMSGMLEATVMSPDLVVDGLKQKSMKDSVVLYSGNQYYSGDLVNKLTQGDITYNTEDDTVYYGVSGNAVQAETKVNVLDTDVLYDGGNGFEIIHATDNVKLAVGGKKYKEGFTICGFPDYTSIFLYSILDGKLIDINKGKQGYALFDLDGKYGELAFDVGREISGGSDSDATLKVYLDGVLQDDEYQLSGTENARHIVVPLKGAKSLKLTLETSNEQVRYAFVNPVLTIS